MLRYYMTPETRDAVIAESNRLIAERAATHASRRQAEAQDAESPDGPPLDSAFARLVSELQLIAEGSARR